LRRFTGISAVTLFALSVESAGVSFDVRCHLLILELVVTAFESNARPAWQFQSRVSKAREGRMNADVATR
jgi:hypothetical protein